MYPSADFISLQDILACLDRVAPVIELMDEAMSADGKPDDASTLGKIRQHIHDIIKLGNDFDLPEGIKAYVDE